MRQQQKRKASRTIYQTERLCTADKQLKGGLWNGIKCLQTTYLRTSIPQILATPFNSNKPNDQLNGAED